jgi:Ni/Fe-hydrogenase subunit HybB-like protein
MAILVGSLGLRFFDDWNFKEGVFTGLGKYLLIFLSFTFLLKLAELVYAGELNLIFENSYQSIMFIIENVLYILPIIILLVPKFKRRRKWIFRAGYLAVGGLVMHRFNVSFVGLAGAKYYPTWQELLSTAGLTAIGIIIFWLIASNLPLMEEEKA